MGVVIGRIPEKQFFRKLQFDSKSNFDEKSLEIQMCQKFSPPFSVTKTSIRFYFENSFDSEGI